MKSIRINDNTKGKLCCSASIDITVGCNNMCIGCYGLKASRMGSKFFSENPEIKEYNDEVFRKDCKKYLRKGIKFVRLGKFSDPGYAAVRGRTLQILQTATSEGIRVVLISKSIVFDKDIAAEIRKGDHILHISLGMISNACPDTDRLNVYRRYKQECHYNVFLRITADVTQEMPEKYRGLKDVILTPMRYGSKKDLESYGANIDKFEWLGGYYRPKALNKSWIPYMCTICGELDGKTYCANCGVVV
jgi:hypothetical protein